MAIAGLILGVVLGGLFLGFRGSLIGAALGWLIGRDVEQRQRLARLEKEVGDLRAQSLTRQVVVRPVARSAAEAEAPAPIVPAAPPDTGWIAPQTEIIRTASVAQTTVVAPVPVPAPAQAPTPSPNSNPFQTPFPPAPAAPALAKSEPARAPTPHRELSPVLPPPQVLLSTEWLPTWFVEGNPAVKVGVVLLLMGVAFLLKYTAQFVHFPIELRYLATITGAALMVGIGWRQREKRPVFGQGLQAGGAGLAFLAVFAAFRLHQLIDPGAAFALLAAIAICTGTLAVMQSTQTLAVMAIAGGFMAPILASTGKGDHVALFSYYAVLNLGIAAAARARAWRGLNLLGFLFTFVIGSIWGVLAYRADRFASTEPFLIGYFLFYVGLTVAFARRRVAEEGEMVKDPVDATLAFGVPLVGFGLQAILVKDFAYGTAWSAAALALFYGAMWLGLRNRRGLAPLAEAFLALGVGFATVTIPLACGAAWTAASWALEGAGLIWIGCRQQRGLSRWTGYLLLGLAGCVAVWHWSSPEAHIGWINGALFGCVMVAVAAWLAAAVVARWGRDEESMPAEYALHWLLLGWGVLIWLAGGLTEIDRFVEADQQVNALLLWAAGSVLAWTAASRLLRYDGLRLPGLALPLAGLIVAMFAHDRFATPLSHGGWLSWPVLFATLWGSLAYRPERLPREGKRLAHIGGWWLLIGWSVWTVADGADRLGAGSSWPWLGALAALALAMRLPQWLGGLWPMRRYRRLYQWWAAWPLATVLAVLLLAAPWASSGDAGPLPYLPFFNPLDIGIALAGLGLLAWCRDPYSYARLAPYRDTVFYCTATLAFGWANAMLARGFHHFGGFEFSAGALLGAPAFQAGLSLLWTTVALATMFYATRRANRGMWIAGAALIGVTVAKLMLVDLDDFGGLARIVSFIGVGLLLVGVGFFAPVPPAIKAEERVRR